MCYCYECLAYSARFAQARSLTHGYWLMCDYRFFTLIVRAIAADCSRKENCGIQRSQHLRSYHTYRSSNTRWFSSEYRSSVRVSRVRDAEFVQIDYYLVCSTRDNKNTRERTIAWMHMIQFRWLGCIRFAWLQTKRLITLNRYANA